MSLKTSKAHIDLISQCFDTVSRDDEATVSLDSDYDAMCDVQDLQRSVSTASFTSLQMSTQLKNSSKTNLLIASVSACSVLETPQFTALHESQPVSVKSTFFSFTRDDLQKRLQNLVKKSIKKNYNCDVEVILQNLILNFFTQTLNFFLLSCRCREIRLKSLHSDTAKFREQQVNLFVLFQ